MKDKKEEPFILTKQKINRRNFISFTTFFAAGVTAFTGWKWLYHSPEEAAGVTAGAHRPLRKALNKSELLFRKLFSNNHLVQTYPKSMAAKSVRVNSNIGINDLNFNLQNWELQIKRKNGEFIKVTLNEIRALPKTEIVYDFKCVEGWDQIQHWGGVKFSDFIKHFNLIEEAQLPYIGMETPNGEYYVGLESESALHPQTILAYEMNDQLLKIEHGAPLRLIIPVKYGIKNLKRIGMISFSDSRPKDYWAERGYDYYSGL